MSDPDLSGYFLNQSNDDMAIVKMEDTLDVCSYRRVAYTNLSNILNDKDTSTLVYHDVIAEYSFNTSTFDDTLMDELNTSTNMMDDTMNVCNYRCRSKVQSLTPAQYHPWMTKNFNKCIVPFALFSPSPIPMASSPIVVNNSSYESQSSDQSDDTTNLSAE